jgi:hypothetical protein
MKKKTCALLDYFAGYMALDNCQRLQLIHNYVSPINDPCLDYAVVVLAAIFEGTDPVRLASFCGYELAFVQAVAKRMIASKLWIQARVDYSFVGLKDEGEQKGAFRIDVLIAKGWVTRTGRRRKGWRYWLTEQGELETAQAAGGSTTVQNAV